MTRKKRRTSSIKSPTKSDTDVSSTLNTQTAKIKGVEERISDLETVISGIMEKLVEIETQIANVSLLTLKPLIQQLIHCGESMTIDELADALVLPGYDWNLIEQALIDLIENDVFEASKAKSERKIAGNFGQITRKL
ncbi:MAG: hypothetical protein ACFFAJ_18420 [Candidatus Hodarchaeota archaeon]